MRAFRGAGGGGLFRLDMLRRGISYLDVNALLCVPSR